jgi:hypothetical protein
MSNLDKFDPATAGKYDPGHVVVFFDNRTYKTFEDKHSLFSNAYLQAMSQLGWSNLTGIKDLEPGKLRIVFYTVCQNSCLQHLSLHLKKSRK